MDTLINCAHKSDMNQKHSCIATKNGKIISNCHYNYKRNKIFGIKFGTAHAEMCVVNNLINSCFYEKNIKRYIL